MTKYTFPYNDVDSFEQRGINDLILKDNIIAARLIKSLHNIYGANFCASLEIELEKMYQDVKAKLQPEQKKHVTFLRLRKKKLADAEGQAHLLTSLENIVRIRKIFRAEFKTKDTEQPSKSRM
jgi:hypothetical protein